MHNYVLIMRNGEINAKEMKHGTKNNEQMEYAVSPLCLLHEIRNASYCISNAARNQHCNAYQRELFCQIVECKNNEPPHDDICYDRDVPHPLAEHRIKYYA